MRYKVSRSFWCYNNQLTSLEGSPEKVELDFDCSFNQLKTLKGSPEKIGRIFDCSRNNLTNLKYAPTKILGDCDVSSNLIKTLENCEIESIKGDFMLQDNDIKISSYDVRMYLNIGGDIYV